MHTYMAEAHYSSGNFSLVGQAACWCLKRPEYDAGTKENKSRTVTFHTFRQNLTHMGAKK